MLNTILDGNWLQSSMDVGILVIGFGLIVLFLVLVAMIAGK